MGERNMQIQLENVEQISKQLIVHSDLARDYFVKALADARQLKIHSVEQNLEKAQTELELAQKLEADLLEREKQGAGPELSLHLVHAQGHVMNATTIGYLTKEIINIHTERVNKQF